MILREQENVFLFAFRLIVPAVQKCLFVHVPNLFFLGGGSGSEDRGGGDNSIQFINFGRVGDKSVKEWRQKIGGVRVGDNNILTFLSHCTRKKCHLPVYFYTQLLPVH